MTDRDDPGPDPLDDLSGAIAGDVPIDWEAEAARDPDRKGRLASLRRIEEVWRAHREVAREFDAPAVPRGLFVWGHLVALEHVGKGGFGDVYRALDTRLHREVALKLRRVEDEVERERDESNERFLEEARHLARIRHSNVLVVHGADVHDGQAGLWTDFVRGRSLAQILAEEGPLAPVDAVRAGLAVARALGAVHAAGLIHGDVTASNVMRDDGGRILLMDFGSVSRRDQAAHPRFGTPVALAPEILRGEVPTASADLYSLGVLLYRVLTGAYPVPAATWPELLALHERGERVPLAGLRPDLAPELVRAVERGLDPDPGARWGSAEEFAEVLGRAVPEALDPSERRQSLRDLVGQLGRLPEEMCRQIGMEIARLLLRRGDSGVGGGDASGIDLDDFVLRPDGTLEFADSGTASGPETTERETVRGLGFIIVALSGGEDALTPFFADFVRALLDPSSSLSLRDAVQILNEAERSAWWRSRQRMRRRAERRSPRRVSVARPTAVHDRETELRTLRLEFERAVVGDGRVVLLEGEPGIGKTRLVDEFVSVLEREGSDFDFLFGSYPPGGAASPAGALLEGYREWLAGDLDALEDHLASAPLLVPAFRALLMGESSDPSSPSLTKESLQTGFVHVIRALAAERPLVMLIDDLHFAPDEGRSLFAALAMAAPGHRLLLLGTARPGLPAGWIAEILRLEHAQRIALPRVSADAIVKMVGEALASPVLGESLGPELARRSDGNPFFLFECLHALEERVRRDAHGRWILSGSPASFPMPSSIEHLIQARLVGLAEEDQELLDVASCCGFEFDPALVGEVTGVGTLTALRRLLAIEKRHRLVRADGHGYVFDHHQVQEAIQAGLSPHLRELYHGKIASAFESRIAAGGTAGGTAGGEADGANAVFLCDQYFRGARFADGVRHLDRALTHLGTLQPALAESLLRRALAVPDLVAGKERIELLARQSSLLFLLGRREEEWAALEETRRHADVLGDAGSMARARRMLGFYHIRSGRPEEARAALGEARQLAREAADDSEEAKIEQTAGRAALDRGQFDEALAAYRASRDFARRAGETFLEMQVVGSMGVVYKELRRFDEAEACFHEVLEMARGLGSRSTELIAIGNLGAVLLDAERPDEALPMLELHLRGARESGIRMGEVYASGNLGELEVSRGRIAAGLERFDRAIVLARETGNRITEAIDRLRRAEAMQLLGRWDEARAELESTIELTRAFQNRRMEGAAHMVLGYAAVQTGDLEEARRRVELVTGSWRGDVDEEHQTHVHMVRGLAHELAGRFDEARSEFESALRCALAAGSVRMEVLARARLAVLDGAFAEEAAARLDRLERRLAVRVRIEARHLLFRATGNSEHAREARRLLEGMVQESPVADRRPMVERVPLYRAVMAVELR